jgi:hypothetical protein
VEPGPVHRGPTHRTRRSIRPLEVPVLDTSFAENATAAQFLEGTRLGVADGAPNSVARPKYTSPWSLTEVGETFALGALGGQDTNFRVRGAGPVGSFSRIFFKNRTYQRPAVQPFYYVL